VVAIVGAPVDASTAKHRRHVVHHHRTHVSVQMVHAATPQSTTLGPMRYHDGPKSPMSREAR
jgi:hypothetical protein